MSSVEEFADEFQLLFPHVWIVAEFYWPGTYFFCQVSGAGEFLARREQDCARF